MPNPTETRRLIDVAIAAHAAGDDPHAGYVRESSILRVSPSGTITSLAPSANTDAARGTAILAAQTAASAGDTIMVWGDAEVSARLGKDGVDWWFAPGVRVQSSSTHSVFDDGDTEMSFRVGGLGSFQATDRVVQAQHADTVIDIECLDILATGEDGVGVYSEGLVRVRAHHRIRSDQYDALWCGNGGTIIAHADEVWGGDSALELQTGSSGYVVARSVNGYFNTTDSATLRVYAGRIEGVDVGGGKQVTAIEGCDDALIVAQEIIGKVWLRGSETVRIVGATITPAGTNPGVEITDAPTLTLENCRIVGGGSFGITSLSTVVVNVIGSLVSSPVAHSGVILNPNQYRVVEANTAGSGSPNVLTAAESGKLFTNQGATAQNYHTLPSAAAGLRATFYVQDSDGIRIVAATGDTIRVAGDVSPAGGYVEASTVGNAITLEAINATEWVATAVVGTWTVST